MGLFSRRKVNEEPKEIVPAPSDGKTWEFKVIKEADPLTHSMAWSAEIYRSGKPINKIWAPTRDETVYRSNEIRNKIIAAENAEKNAEIITIS